MTAKNKIKELLKRYNELSKLRKLEILEMSNIVYHSCSIEGSTLTKKETFILILEKTFEE